MLSVSDIVDECMHAERIAEEGVPFRQIAEAIGQGLGLPATSVSPASGAAR
jgi:hypothetical protein